MSTLALFVEAFHFLRPGILLLLPVILWLWWAIRRAGQARGALTDRIAPHLRAALTIGARGAGRVRPIDGVAVTLILVTLGGAGPTWSRQVDPFAAQSAPAVVVLAVTGSMQEVDVPPSRLTACSTTPSTAPVVRMRAPVSDTEKNSWAVRAGQRATAALAARSERTVGIRMISGSPERRWQRERRSSAVDAPRTLDPGPHPTAMGRIRQGQRGPRAR